MTMDDKEILALAREFAEETRNGILGLFPQPLPDSMEVLIKNDQEYYGRFLRWLTGRYYLVEKDRVKDEYEKAKMDMVSKYHQGSMVVLQVLFPDLGKEVEE